MAELSALADGSSPDARARELEAHVAGCPACAIALDDLRAVRSMLRAMPVAETSRSFRLREADAERSAAARPTWASFFGAMPALGAAALVLFVAVAATDVVRQSGGDDASDSAGPMLSAGRLEERSTGAFAPYPTEKALGIGESTQNNYDALQPTAPSSAGGAAAEAPTDSAPSGDSAPFEDGDDAAARLQPDSAETPQEAPPQAVAPAPRDVEATSRVMGEEDGGNIPAIRIVEITALGIAGAAGLLYFATRRRRSEG